MIVLLITLPIIAYTSMISFNEMNFSVLNYQSRRVPYNLGVVIFYCYAVLYSYPPSEVESLSFTAFLFIFGVWLLGFIDDLFGKPYPKGLKGHLRYATKTKKITTGLLKAIGTTVLAIFYLWSKQPATFVINLISFFLLTGMPHMMNLFDTKPLRVWKVTCFITIIIIMISPLPPLLFVISLLALFYVIYVLEGYRKAMLGDNGSNVVGAIVAIVVINETNIQFQLGLLIFTSLIIVLSEKVSLSSLIDRWILLKKFDQIGRKP